jgi:hypothetical protein
MRGGRWRTMAADVLTYLEHSREEDEEEGERDGEEDDGGGGDDALGPEDGEGVDDEAEALGLATL